ncbi:MAG: hypothetical protein ACRD6W_09245 [Nitrososphaerales archaeon]
MSIPLLLLAPAVASAVGLPLVGQSGPLDIGSTMQQFASQFATETAAVLTSVDTAVLDIARIAYVTCLLIGVLLYFTRLGRRMGKDLIVGGVVLAVIAEYLIPTFLSVGK